MEDIDTQIKRTGRAIEQFLLPPKPAALTVNDEAEKNSLKLPIKCTNRHFDYRIMHVTAQLQWHRPLCEGASIFVQIILFLLLFVPSSSCHGSLASHQ